MPGVVGTVPTLSRTIPQPMGSPDTIVASIGAAGVPGHLKADYLKQLRAAAESGFISDYRCPNGVSPTGVGTQLGVATAQAGLSAGLDAVKIGTTALNAIPIVGNILSSAISLITVPFAHHKAAVAREQATLCTAVPEVNAFLRQLDQYVLTGQWDHVTAVQEMENGFKAWVLEVKGILQDSGGKCNAACFYERQFRAAIEKRKIDYQANESSFSLGAHGLANSVISGVSGVPKKLTDFLKKESGAITSGLKAGNYQPLISALLVGAVIVGSVYGFSRLWRATQ